MDSRTATARKLTASGNIKNKILNFKFLVILAINSTGVPEGNRTLVAAATERCSTIELQAPYKFELRTLAIALLNLIIKPLAQKPKGKGICCARYKGFI